ncbi:MAG: acyltransferase domain-containing protein [Thermoanaerobaculia bacterium]
MKAAETVFMFSGQGSHYFQMGRALFDENDSFRGWMLRLDEVVWQSAGASIVETLYADSNSKGDPFDRTLYTHPAIFMVEYALARSLMDAGVWPDMVLGVSLGSFAAAAVAGCMEAEEALSAVIRQAMALEASCEPGGLTAILADPALFAEEFISRRSELAAVNFASHFVVSARQAELGEIETVLRQRNVGYQRLAVSFPFHSKWIDRAREPFAAYMQTVRCKPPRLPVACCDRSAVVADVSGDYFWDVVRQPMRFRETIAHLEAQGPRRYVDVGPAGTLATFLKHGMLPGSRSTAHPIMTPFGTDRRNLAALLAAVRN